MILFIYNNCKYVNLDSQAWRSKLPIICNLLQNLINKNVKKLSWKDFVKRFLDFVR